MNTDNHEQVENIQALRGLAVLLVLFAHVGFYEGRFFKGEEYLGIFTLIGGAGVDLFFVISGFIMMTICHGKFATRHGSLIFLMRRVARIYPLYWVFCLLYLPVYLFYPEMMNRQEGTAGISLVRSFLLLPHTQGPLVGQGWTLVHEMYFYLVFSIALFFRERFKSYFLAAWLSLVFFGGIAAASFPTMLDSPAIRLITNPLTLEFIAGCIVAILAMKVNSRSWGIFLVGLGAVGLVVPGFFQVSIDKADQFQRVAIWLLPAAFLVLGAVSLEKSAGLLFPKWLRFTGDISYSVYLSHMIAVSGGQKIFRYFGFDTSASAHMLFIVSSITFAIVVGAFVHFAVERPLLGLGYTAVNWVRRKLDGGKEDPRKSALSTQAK